MNSLHFFRKPFRLILIILLFLLLSVTALVFSLQSVLDGLIMTQAENGTAYVGTVYSRMQKNPLIQPLPESVLSVLNDSELVDTVMLSPLYSAKAEGLMRMADGFGNVEGMEQKLFLEGIVEQAPSLVPDVFGMLEAFPLKISRNWGGIWDGEYIQVMIFRGESARLPLLQAGDHVFLVGRYNCNSLGDVTGMLLYDPDMLGSMGIHTDSAIWNHGIFVLPRDLSQESSVLQIKRYLQETGLQSSLTLANQIRSVFPVREVTDMSMLLTAANGSTFLTAGRMLSPADSGKRVCVISEALATGRGLTLGNTISLGIAGGCYAYRDSILDYSGWESGYPFENDTMLEYPEADDFEIVGIYSEINRKIGSADFTHHSRNCIFVPAGLMTAQGGSVPAVNLTFRILGPNYEDFLDAFEVSLNEQGYTLSLLDTGWETISGSFYAMNSRRILLTFCAITAFIAAVLSFTVLLSNYFRHDYALSRLLGATPPEARKSIFQALTVTALPAILLAVLLSFGWYFLWVKNPLAATLLTALPADRWILRRLFSWAAAEVAAAWVLLWGFTWAFDRRSLVRLLK